MQPEATLMAGGEPNAALIRIRDVVTYWTHRATPRAWGRMGAATLLALCYAGGTAAAAALVAHLAKAGDVQSVVENVTPVQLTAFGLFLLRPLLYVGHVHFVRQAIVAVLERDNVRPAFVSYMLLCFITLSRDLPAILVLSAAMLLHGGAAGLAVALIVFGSLGLAVPLRDLADRHYLQPSATATKRERRVEAVLRQRAARSWAEASADASFALLIIGLLLLGFLHPGGTTSALIGTAVTALLMTTPIRRIARLLGSRREQIRKHDGDNFDFEA